MFGASFWKFASFLESESWFGAKSEVKLRKLVRYLVRRLQGIYFPGIPGVFQDQVYPQNTRYFADLADFGLVLN